MFKLWSETNIEAKKILKPDLEMRNFNKLTLKDKQKIWKFLQSYFFKINQSNNIEFVDYYIPKYHLEKAIETACYHLNEAYKTNCFAKNYLEIQNLDSACTDFFNIFMKAKESVVIELLSLYSYYLHFYTKEKATDESEEYKYFDIFAERLNEVFLQFGIKYYLTRNGFIPRQEEKIIHEIYEPVLSYLSDSKWNKVNEILSDAFSDYRKNTPQGYSGCITNTIASLEAYLQILFGEKIGKKKLSVLIKEGLQKNLIPKDPFTEKIFDNIESVFAQERQSSSDAHPKTEYATEKNARMVLNLAMIFMQHCIQK